MSTKKIDLPSIQFGTLSNGIFEKTEGECEKTSVDVMPGGKLHLKKYMSSYIWYFINSYLVIDQDIKDALVEQSTWKDYFIIYSFIRESKMSDQICY